MIAGAGNLATCLGVALKKAGMGPVAVWSRSSRSAQALAARLDCEGTTGIESLPDADIVITAVSDDALPEVAKSVASRFPDSVVVHTAGSVPMEIWKNTVARQYGVFYPMQTFSKTKEVDFSKVGIFVDGSSEDVCARLESLARILSPLVYRINDEQRGYLHIAAVFACNFANAMYSISAELLEKQGLPFEIMLPLIDETAAKIHSLSPGEAQTGPAHRRDETVIERQRAMLTDEKREIYDLVTRYIVSKVSENRYSKEENDKLRLDKDKGVGL